MATREGELFVEKIEVSLDGRQIFCLFCGGAVIASLVFVLGVMVGRRVESRDHPDQIAAGSAATDPLAALDQLAAVDTQVGSELAFASTLRGGDGAGAPLGAVDVSLERPAAGDSPGEDGKATAEKPVAPTQGKPVAAPAAEPKPVTPAPPAAEVSADKARFTLQLSSFQERSEADAFLAELKRAGHAVFLVEAEVDGKGTWFRVRLGQYRTYDDAVAAKAEFEKKQKIIAYVTRTKS